MKSTKYVLKNEQRYYSKKEDIALLHELCIYTVDYTRTKKQAKHLCAQQALRSFVQFRDATDGTFDNAMTNSAMVRKVHGQILVNEGVRQTMKNMQEGRGGN